MCSVALSIRYGIFFVGGIVQLPVSIYFGMIFLNISLSRFLLF